MAVSPVTLPQRNALEQTSSATVTASSQTAHLASEYAQRGPLRSFPEASTSGRTWSQASRPFPLPLFSTNERSSGPASSANERISDIRLELAPKRRSVLPHYSPGVADADPDKVAPRPDWTLEDLAHELESILPQRRPDFQTFHPTPSHSKRLSFQDVVETASFSRKKASFVMRVSEEDMAASDEEDGESATSRLEPDRTTLASQSGGAEQRGNHVGQISPEKRDLGIVQGSRGVRLLPRTSSVEAALLELERSRVIRVREEVRLKQASLAQLLQQEAEREAMLLASLETEANAKVEQLRSEDKSDQESIAEARSHHLSVLQRDHAERTTQDEQELKQRAAEEARKRAEEAEARTRQEQEVRAKAEAEARARQEAEQKARVLEEAERQKRAQAAAAKEAKAQAEAQAEAAAAQKQKAAEGQAQAEKSAAGGGPPGGPKARVAEGAARAEAERLEKLSQLRNSIRQFEEDPALKKERKALERRVVTLIQQISATQEQVRRKSAEIKALLQQAQQPQQSFLILTLANKLLPQCESQVQKMPSFAFPLAQVVVNVGVEVPYVMDILLARLHQECLFTVPKYYVYNSGQFRSEADYYQLLGYRSEDGKTEPTDDFIGRMSGIMTFYAAICQTSPPGMSQNPHGLAQAWAWFARLLNRLPPNRATATALESMLKVTGYRLHQEYTKQFLKLLHVIMGDFANAVKQSGDRDASAVLNRLETYIQGGRFMQPPEGRNMPATDESSQIRA